MVLWAREPRPLLDWPNGGGRAWPSSNLARAARPAGRARLSGVAGTTLGCGASDSSQPIGRCGALDRLCREARRQVARRPRSGPGARGWGTAGAPGYSPNYCLTLSGRTLKSLCAGPRGLRHPALGRRVGRLYARPWGPEDRLDDGLPRGPGTLGHPEFTRRRWTLLNHRHVLAACQCGPSADPGPGRLEHGSLRDHAGPQRVHLYRQH